MITKGVFHRVSHRCGITCLSSTPFIPSVDNSQWSYRYVMSEKRAGGNEYSLRSSSPPRAATRRRAALRLVHPVRLARCPARQRCRRHGTRDEPAEVSLPGDVEARDESDDRVDENDPDDPGDIPTQSPVDAQLMPRTARRSLPTRPPHRSSHALPTASEAGTITKYPTEPPIADSRYSATKRARPSRFSRYGPRIHSAYMFITMCSIKSGECRNADVRNRYGCANASTGTNAEGARDVVPADPEPLQARTRPRRAR